MGSSRTAWPAASLGSQTVIPITISEGIRNLQKPKTKGIKKHSRNQKYYIIIRICKVPVFFCDLEVSTTLLNILSGLQHGVPSASW